MIYGPTLFSLVERVGDDALIAPNGVVAGDSFGNGHFLTSGGAMTGMVGHSARVLEYWRSRDAGISSTKVQQVGEQTQLNSKLSIGSVAPESATIYAFLDIQQNEQAVQRIAIKENQALIGRIDPKRGITPDIDLTKFDPSITVSRRHVRIRLDNSYFFIEDLESRNKTRLGELTLTPHEPVALHNGDVVTFGSVKATFRLRGTSSLPDPWSQSWFSLIHRTFKLHLNSLIERN